MDNPEKKDPVWKLLSHASHTEPGPFFARNVVREVRNLPTPGTRFGEWMSLLRSPRVAGGLTAAALAVASVVFFATQGPASPDALPIAEVPAATTGADENPVFDPASELEAVAQLGQLMAVTDPAQLSDEQLGDLFF